MTSRGLHLALALVAAVAFGCREKPKFTQPFQLAGGKSIDAKTLNEGHEKYMMYCYACHGENGDGKGPAAAYMRPPPRHFGRGLFKFAGGPAGQLPMDEALDRTIRRGLHGTPMLPWDIPKSERHALIQYIKTFKAAGMEKSRWEEEEPAPEIEISPDPWKGKEAEAVKKGEEVYHVSAAEHAGCSGCHAAYANRQGISTMTQKITGEGVTEFREGLARSSLRTSEYPLETDASGEITKAHEILPPDFLFHRMKTAYPVGTRIHEGDGQYVEYTKEMQLRDLYRTIGAGVGGAAMPQWKGALPEENLWALVYYVQHLAELRGTVEGAKLRASLDAAENAPPPAVPSTDVPKTSPEQPSPARKEG